MGGGFSRLALPSCFKTASEDHHPDLIFTSSEHLDETLGHSFCYVPSSSPSHSSRRFLSPSHSLRLPSETALKTRYPAPETAFRSISGASIGANTSNPRTILQPDVIYRNAADPLARLNSGGFESSSSFYALPLQPVPRICGASDASGPLDRGFFMSGPIERGALSGPLDAGGAGDIHFSAPLGGVYMNKRRRKGFPSSSVRKALLRSFSEKKRPWVVPVLNFVGRKDSSTAAGAGAAAAGAGDGSDLEVNGEKVQWAHGKAGEDRVHVVVSEDHGWLFVGIYDGFNGTDAPEFLMGHLYRAVFKELEGLFWETVEEDSSLVLAQEEVKEEILDDVVTADQPNPSREIADSEKDCCSKVRDKEGQSLECGGDLAPSSLNCGGVKRVTFELEQKMGGSKRGKTLWEYLKEVDDDDEGLDLSGSDRFSFSVANVFRVKTVSSAVGRRPVLFPKLKFGTNREKESQRKLFSCGHDWEDKEKIEVDRIGDKLGRSLRRCKVGPADHASVLSALSRALDITEMAYLEMTDMVLDKNPELALTGSCLLVVLMKDEDVYVMNVGDSRAIVAQYQPHPIGSGSEPQGQAKGGLESEGIVEESDRLGDAVKPVAVEETDEIMKLTALQLSTDHSTSIEEEVLRIKAEHPDDCHCIVNDRVKGRLKVTRAFGAGFLKKPKWNNAMLEMFRNEYIGTDPYITCCPSLCHHKLCSNDHFLVLSSDGLYQYLTNQEVVSYVENFMEKFPDGDPAQNLIEELLSRAAKKAGMDFHELLDIPQGDRRKYHDDVTVMVISLEGRIWKSSGKYV